MPLPAPNTAWPPAEAGERYKRIATNATWYGGDPARLAALYGANTATADTSKRERRLLGVLHDWFWGQNDNTEPDDKVHLPVAQDIATMSADLLFSSPPTFTVQPPTGYEPPPPSTDPAVPTPVDEVAQAVQAAQDRLNFIVDHSGLEATLPAAAETCGALGGVGLRIGWEPGMAAPTITRVDADATYGEWSYGMLTAVTFWRILDRDGEKVTYHLERHERGGVFHGLYVGTRDNLGKPLPLTAHPTTAALDVDPITGWMALVPGHLCAAIVPNMLPDPLDRMALSGRSDFTPGVITLFDAIDRTLTSWMRDIDDGRSRLLVADYMLDSRGPGKGLEFNQDRHIFTPLTMNPSETGGDPPIDQVQFKIRVDEHLRTLDFLVGKAIQACGYNPDSENENDGAAMTATEYTGRNRRSISTRTKKARYWKAAMEPLMSALLAFDVEVVKSGVTALPVSMELAPPSQEPMSTLASTVEVLSRAKAASTETMVRMLHPDWEDGQVEDEVAAILKGDQVEDPNTVPMYDTSVMPSQE